MSIFKAYDIRGVCPSELNEETAYKIGRSFVKYLKCKKVVVGRDKRKSSSKLMKALLNGITDQGADVVDIGTCTTPMLYFSVPYFNFDGGVMVTASHLVEKYNGFKLCKKEGIPLTLDTGIKQIEKLTKNRFKKLRKGKVVKKNILGVYKGFILKDADKTKFKVVVDARNSVGTLNAEIIKEICNVKELFFKELPKDHSLDPLVESNQKNIKLHILKSKADFGVMFDGDADRVVFFDEKSNIIPGDVITSLIAKYYGKKNDKIIIDVRSSLSTLDVIKSVKAIPIISKVGHSFVTRLMRKEIAVFAGEKSGHYFFKETYYLDSAISAVIKVMNIMNNEKKKLSILVKPLIKYYTFAGGINYAVSNKEKALEVVEECFKDGRVEHIDGVSVYYKDYWFNLRKSNTEDVVRLSVEAKTKEKLEKVKERIDNIVNSLS